MKRGLLLAMLAPMLVGWAPQGAECLIEELDGQCESWGVETDYGESWGCCDYGYVEAARHFLAAGERLFLAVPVNDPGIPFPEERYDFQTSVYDASDGRLLWKQRFGRSAWDIPHALSLSPDHDRIYVTGLRDYPQTPNQVGSCAQRFEPASALTIAYDSSTGAELWRSGFSETPFLDAALNAVLSPDGQTLYQVGVRLGGKVLDCDFDAAMTALDAETGQELWSVILAKGNADAYDAINAISITPAGDTAIVSGMIRRDPSRRDFFTAGVDITGDPEDPETRPGAILWQSLYDEGIHGDDVMRDMAVDVPRDRVFVTGEGHEPPVAGAYNGYGQTHYATVAYDGKTGAELWRSRFESLVPGLERPRSIAVSSDGNKVFVTGEAVGAVDQEWDYATVAYDAATGQQLWVARYGTPAGDLEWAYDVLAHPDGAEVYVTGWSTGVPGHRGASSAATIAYDAETGDQLWVARYEMPSGPTDTSIGEQMAISPDGSHLFVTGSARRLREEDTRGVIFSYAL